MTESTLPIRCTAFNSRKIGRTSAAAGTIITTSVSERTSFRPGNFPIARPYPAGTPTTSVIAVALSA